MTTPEFTTNKDEQLAPVLMVLADERAAEKLTEVYLASRLYPLMEKVLLGQIHP